jgi:hypothetical protein
MKKLLLPLIAASALVGTVAVAKPTLLNYVGIGVTPIREVVARPAQLRGQRITLRGKVVNQMGALGVGGYELQDGSGSLWVLTQSGIPEMQQEIFVTGEPNEGIAIAGQTLGVTIQEQQRWQ